MNEQQIQEVIESFAKAAKRAVEAGPMASNCMGRMVI
jgi:hypothetical protein